MPRVSLCRFWRGAVKLNLGCGSEKIEGYVNIDCEETCKPDLVHNFTAAPLPYEDGSVGEIVMFHTVEHIRKVEHGFIFQECARVLKLHGSLLVSYPNFLICADYYRINYKGQREFWEKTIFGRQLYPSDYHVCAIIPSELELLLGQLGFDQLKSVPEAQEQQNWITSARRGSGRQTVNYPSEVERVTRASKYQITRS